jgi:hypothetical protein
MIDHPGADQGRAPVFTMPFNAAWRERNAMTGLGKPGHVLGPLDLPRHPEHALGGASEHC